MDGESQQNKSSTPFFWKTSESSSIWFKVLLIQTNQFNLYFIGPHYNNNKWAKFESLSATDEIA